MSVYYENGQLHRIVFSEQRQQQRRPYLVEVGTRFLFRQTEVGLVSRVLA